MAAAKEAGYSKRSSKSYASRLSAKPANKAAIAGEQDRIADANGFTLGHVIREFELIPDLAKKAGAFRAATSVQASIADMCGLFGPTGAHQCGVAPGKFRYRFHLAFARRARRYVVCCGI